MRRYRDTILDAVNPGAMTSEIQDISLVIGYSLHFIVTGTLTFTSEIYAGNIDDKTKLSLLTGSAQVINSNGFINNTSFAQYDYFYLKISAVAGAGTLKCIRTAKEV
jgi:hypothetical protein